MNRTVLLSSLFAMASLSLLAQGNASWKQTSTTGYYSDGANWSTGVMPTNAAVASVSATGSYTLLAPAGGLTENSTLFMLANGNPLSVTLDSTGTWWKKAAANYPSDWKAFGFSYSGDIGQHIYNMESMSTASGYNVFFISNAVWRFQYTPQAATNVFESGLFDFAYKGETNRTSSTWMIAGAGSPSIQRTLFKPGSHTIFNAFSIRGSAPDQLTVFEGGLHEFYGNLSVKCDSSNASVPDTLLVFSGSSSNLLYSSLVLCNATGNRGILLMESNAYARLSSIYLGNATRSSGLLIMTNNALAQSSGGDISLGANTYSRGDWLMGGNSVYRSTGSGTIRLAPSVGSTGLVTVAENAQMSLESTQGITIGQSTNIFAEMTVKDAAQVAVSGSAAVTIGASAATGTLNLAGSALLNMSGTGELGLGSAAGAVGVLNLNGSSSLTRSNASTIRIGTTGGGTGVVNVADSSVVALSHASGNVTLAGGNSAVGFLNITSNAVLQMQGVLSVCANASGYGEVNLRDNARLDMGTNGTVYIAPAGSATGSLNLYDNAVFYSGAQNKYFRVGDGSGSRAYLNMNSGVFAATNLIVEPYAYYGEINLAGGTSYVGEYRFTGSSSVGTTNKLTVTGGKHFVGAAGINAGNGLNRNDVTLIAVSGGELRSENNGLTLGGGTANVSVAPIQKLTVSSGLFSAGDKNIWVAKVNPSFGRVELTGGEVNTATLSGGAGATNLGGTGYASFFSDGGKIVFQGATSNRFEYLDEAVLGNGGLAISNASLLTVNQAFTDAAASSGTIAKSGSGMLSAAKTSGHALTLIHAGGLTLGPGVTQFGRNIVLAPETTLSVQDNVTLETLAMTNGVLQLSSGKKITGNTVAISNVVIQTSGWTTGSSYDLIEATNLTADNVTVSGEGATQVYSLSVSGGMLTLTVDPTPAPATKTWQGPGSDWSTTGNWNGGSPAKQDTALFDGATPTSVAVDAATSVNTIQFNSASGYTVSGQKLSVFAGVTAVSGEHVIAAPVEVPYTTNLISLTAQSGAKLTLGGPLTENQSTLLTKTGAGTVKLAGANSLSGAISVEGGVLEFGSADSFGAANSSATALSIKAGSIRYSGAAATVTKGLTVADSSTTVTNAFVFDVRSNLTFNGAFNNTKGAPIKIGTGELTLNFPGAGTYPLGSGRGMAVFNGNPPTMNGIPSTGYSGFTVLEGGVTLKGSSTAVIASLPYQTVVGAMVRGTNLAANAALTIDGCRANIGGSGEHLFLGYGIAAGMPTNPTLNVINGGYVLVNALKTSGNPGTFVDSKVNIFNGGWLDSNWALQFAVDNSANGKTTVRMSNGVMRCTSTGVISFGGPLDFVAGSGSAITQTCTGGVKFQNNASGRMLLEGGSRLNYSLITFANSASANLVMQFDNGILQPNLNNTTSTTVRTSGLGFELLTNGVTVDMSVVARHVINLPIRGSGGLIKTGSGELVFADARANNVISPEVTAQYTGLTEVRAGRLTVETNGVGTATRVKVLSGATLNLSSSPIRLGTVEGDGTITNGTLTATLNSTFTNGAVQAVSQPTFANVASSGIMVDFGRTESNPVPLPSPKLAIAKVTGTVQPNVGAWRGQNMGPRVTVKFSIESGTVYAAFGSSGTTIIVR